MSKPTFFATPGYGATQVANIHYSHDCTDSIGDAHNRVMVEQLRDRM